MRFFFIVWLLLLSAMCVSQVQTHSADLEGSTPSELYINKADQTGLDFGGDFTLSAWVRIESSGSTATIISDWRTTGGTREQKYRWRIVSTGAALQLSVSADGDIATDCDISYSFSANVWYYLASTYDASAGTIEHFVNGQSIGTCGSMATSLWVSSYNWPLKIGVIQVNNNPFDGLIKSVRIFDDIRTPAEIRSDAYSGGVTDGNLQAEWMLNNALTDASGNGNTLNNTATTFTSTLPPWIDYSFISGQPTLNITHIGGISKTAAQ